MESLVKRKLEYIRMLASIRGAYQATLRWEALLPIIHVNLGGKYLLRLLLDMYLALNLNIDSSEFQWHNLNFKKIFSPEIPEDIPTPNLGRMSPTNLEQLAYSLLLQLVTKEGYYWKKSGYHALKTVWWFEDILRENGVDEIVLVVLRDIISVIIAKTQVTTYVGTAIVGISRVNPTSVYTLDPYNYKKKRIIYPTAFYENYVGFARVGYARVGAVMKGSEYYFTETLVDHVKETLIPFLQRTGMVHGSPEQVLYQRVFWWRKHKKMHTYGGHHQLKLQMLIRKVKQILDQEGVLAQHRMAYIIFAEELAYLKYKGHRKLKYWKEILTEDQLIDKYKRMGCKESILEKIKKVV